jgi:hypothetical protein
MGHHALSVVQVQVNGMLKRKDSAGGRAFELPGRVARALNDFEFAGGWASLWGGFEVSGGRSLGVSRVAQPLRRV